MSQEILKRFAGPWRIGHRPGRWFTLQRFPHRNPRTATGHAECTDRHPRRRRLLRRHQPQSLSGHPDGVRRAVLPAVRTRLAAASPAAPRQHPAQPAKEENASHHLATAAHGRSYSHIGTRPMRKKTNTQHPPTSASILQGAGSASIATFSSRPTPATRGTVPLRGVRGLTRRWGIRRAFAMPASTAAVRRPIAATRKGVDDLGSNSAANEPAATSPATIRSEKTSLLCRRVRPRTTPIATLLHIPLRRYTPRNGSTSLLTRTKAAPIPSARRHTVSGWSRAIPL